MKRSLLSASILRALAAVPLFVGMGGMAASAQQADEAAQDEAQRLERVEVTGSRIKRAEIEGPAPVTVITREEMEREGFTTVFDALNTLTQTSGVTQNELTQSGFTPNASMLNLRSLGPGRVLTLINGRRAADYPLPFNGQSNFVNLASIPAAAVDRVEVLAGGASAIYGSDAVAGVINVVLRTNYDGDQVTLRAGAPTQGGSDTLDLQWAGGKSGDRWSLTYAFQAYNRDPIYGLDRDFMDSYRDDPTTRDNPSPASAIRIRDRTLSANNYHLPGGAEACERFGYELYNVVSGGNTLGPVCGSWDYPAHQTVRNGDDNLSGYVYGTWLLDGGTELWGSLSVWDSTATMSSGLEFWQSGLVYDQGLDTVIDIQRILALREVGGLSTMDRVFEERAYDAAFGIRGTIADRFDWDFTLSRSSYSSDNDRRRLLVAPVAEYFLGPQLGTRDGRPVYNVNYQHLMTPMTPEQYLAMSTVVQTRAESESNQASFTITGDLWDMPAGPVGFAAVLEAGSQEYELNADPRIMPGQNVVYNLTGTGGGGERDRYALGVEFKVPLLESLTASAAARYDKYDDVTRVDDAITYNLGLEWRPTDALLLRGSYATSFRAPDMHFVFAEQSGSYSTVQDEYTCRAAGMTTSQCGVQDPAYNYTVFNVRQGSPGLTEEEGKSWTAGVVWDIVDDLSLSLDYYKIEIEGLVSDITAAYILENEANCRLGVTRSGSPFEHSMDSLFCRDIVGRVQRTSGTGTSNDGRIEQLTRGPMNRAFQSTEGLDATLSFRHQTDRFGSFAYQLGWSHTLGEKRAEFADSEPVDVRDQLNNLAFRSRMRGSVSWNYGDWTTTVFGLRYGSLPDWSETGARVAPYHLYNASVRYQVNEAWSVAMLANNVLDKKPTIDQTFFDYPFFWRGYDAIGRELFLQVDYRF